MEVMFIYWVLLGKYLIVGNGWLVEVLGFLIELIWLIDGEEIDENLFFNDKICVYIIFMCGCVIKLGGYWLFEWYDVSVILF